VRSQGTEKAEVFENDVSAEAEADEGELLISFCDGVVDDGLEVFTDAGVVRAEEAIGLAGAATAVPSEGVPVAFLEGERHAANVFRRRLTF